MRVIAFRFVTHTLSFELLRVRFVDVVSNEGNFITIWNNINFTNPYIDLTLDNTPFQNLITPTPG